VLFLFLRLPSAVADPTTAAAAYRQAEELVKQGKWAEACPFYEASFKDDQQLGALLHLADCNERIGKLASAWAEWTDAAELAHSRNDKREATARTRADALVPKLAKLHVVPPKTAVPGLLVRRDGIDITALLGTDMPIDPGEHELTASAPGYTDWSSKLTIAPAAKSAVDIPELEKIAVKPVEPAKPEVHEGHIVITTDATADIYLDAQKVGTGRYEGTVRAGGHTLRIAGDGMRPYQSEILVGDNENRTIDVPLEKIVVPAYVPGYTPIVPHENLPTFEFGVSTSVGVKLRNDNPLVTNVRFELAARFGRRVNAGFYAELGNIDTTNACGFDMPGAMPSGPFDYGERLQFKTCRFITPGVQVLVHILPGKRIDPYIGFSPGFRFLTATWTPYVAGQPQASEDKFFPAIVTGFRAGVNYHLKPGFKGLVVGAFFEDELTIIGDETTDTYDSDHSPQTFNYVLGGVRTTVSF
jgi:hypothetical protein